MGWQRLIPDNILSSTKIGIFGMHGSSEGLPKGRGRSPLNWSLILNYKYFSTSLIKYDNSINSKNNHLSKSFKL